MKTIIDGAEIVIIEDFITYCKQYIYDHIEDYRGQSLYACDLGFTLTERPNCDGTLTYNRKEAEEYLKEWWYDAADYYDYERANFGSGGHNPFENPEAYMVCMVIEGVNVLISYALSEIDGVDWNGMVELTDDLIKRIVEIVENTKTVKLF